MSWLWLWIFVDTVLLLQQEMFHIKFVMINVYICNLSFCLYHICFIGCKSLCLFVLCPVICILINEQNTTPFRNSVYFILSTLVYSWKYLCIAERSCICAGEPHWWSAAGCVPWRHGDSCQSTRHGLSREQTLTLTVDTLWGSVILRGLLQKVSVYSWYVSSGLHSLSLHFVVLIRKWEI